MTFYRHTLLSDGLQPFDREMLKVASYDGKDLENPLDNANTSHICDEIRLSSFNMQGTYYYLMTIQIFT